MSAQALGQHLLVELFDVDAHLLSDALRLEQVLREAAEAAGASVLFGHFHQFGAGLGVTGVLLLQESHISIHTWPEHAFAAADVFMCGSAQPGRAVEVLVELLGVGRVEVKESWRGQGVPEVI